MTMSASATKCSPPPAQVPLTAATTGFHTWFCQAVRRSSARTGASRLLAQSVGVPAQLHDVEAGLEGAALAGVDDDPHIGVGVELAPGRLELVEHGGIHRVGGLRSVEDEPTDRALALDTQRRVAAQLRGTSFHGDDENGSGSRARPRTRSPRMFLLTSVVPPSIVLARLRNIPRTSYGNEAP